MSLIKYLYVKILSSFFICLLSCLTIFYIFSLIGNLGENLPFASILFLSFLNSVQILTYVPSLVILLSLILFINFLRTKNELIIIKEYLSNNKVLIAFVPLALIFTIVEIYKENASDNIEKYKNNYVNSNNLMHTKVIIDINDEYKSYLILKDLNIANSTIKEFQKYEIDRNNIIGGEYSNKLKITDDNLITNEFIRYQDNMIMNFNEENIIFTNIKKLSLDNIIVNKLDNHNLFNFNFLNTNEFIYFILFYLSLFFILMSKKIVDRKQSIAYPIFLGFLLLFYLLIINNIELKFLNHQYQILTLVLVSLTFFKFYKYE